MGGSEGQLWKACCPGPLLFQARRTSCCVQPRPGRQRTTRRYRIYKLALPQSSNIFGLNRNLNALCTPVSLTKHRQQWQAPLLAAMTGKPVDVICDGDVCRRVSVAAIQYEHCEARQARRTEHLHPCRGPPLLLMLTGVFVHQLQCPRCQVTPEEAAAAASVTVESAASELDTVKALLGDTLHGKDGKEVATASVLGAGKIIALYFSAHCESVNRSSSGAVPFGFARNTGRICWRHPTQLRVATLIVWQSLRH